MAWHFPYPWPLVPCALLYRLLPLFISVWGTVQHPLRPLHRRQTRPQLVRRGLHGQGLRQEVARYMFDVLCSSHVADPSSNDHGYPLRRALGVLT
jgi:hypothetical protein